MCAVYRGPVCKLCRREGEKLFLKGKRCNTAKCAIERREYPPGLHGTSRRFRPSGYGIQLREKQKVRRSVQMTEKQFRKFFALADKKQGPTGANLLTMLESRLDNVLRLTGFSISIKKARQLINHGHVKINGQTCTVSSRIVEPGDTVSIKPKSRDMEAVKMSLEESENMPAPEWIKVNRGQVSGEILRVPTREEITLCGGDISENLIVELYSK